MTDIEVSELFVERARLRDAINADLIAFTGQAADFIWTDRILESDDGKRWHEFKVIDTQLLAYAAFKEHGELVVVVEEEEINNP